MVSRRASVPLAIACALASLGIDETAMASPAARLVYVRSPESLSSCPDEAALRQAVAARFGYDPFFPWAHATIVVQVWREHARLRTRTQLVDEHGVSRGMRDLASDRAGCGEIFAATALAITIALEAPAADELVPAPEAKPESVPVAVPVPPSASVPPPTPMAPSPTAPAFADADVTGASGPPDDAAPAARTPNVGWTLGIEARGGGDIGKNGAMGAGLLGRARIGWFSLSLEGLSDFAFPFPVGGAAKLESTAFAGALVPCGHFGVVFGCAVGELGALVVRGTGSPDTRTRTGVLAEAGLRLGIEWPTSGPLALRVRGDGMLNLDRHRLVSVDGGWWQDPVTYGLGLGALYRFR